MEVGGDHIPQQEEQDDRKESSVLGCAIAPVGIKKTWRSEGLASLLKVRPISAFNIRKEFYPTIRLA